MTRVMLLVTLFFACTAWADGPDHSRFEARLQEARARLGLTEEQQARLRPILEGHFAAQMAILDQYGLGVGTRDGDRQPGFQKMRALRNELNANKTKTAKQLSGILSKEQIAEFEKIQAERKLQLQEILQSKHIEKIGTKLALTETQMARLKPILEHHFATQMTILDKHGINIGNQEGSQRPGFISLRALRNDMNENRARTMKQLSGILSAEQLAAFEKMQAEQRERMREHIHSGS